MVTRTGGLRPAPRPSTTCGGTSMPVAVLPASSMMAWNLMTVMTVRPGRTHRSTLIRVDDERHDGICAGSAPPIVGGILTDVGLTLAEAAAALERGDRLP